MASAHAPSSSRPPIVVMQPGGEATTAQVDRREPSTPRGRDVFIDIPLEVDGDHFYDAAEHHGPQLAPPRSASMQALAVERPPELPVYTVKMPKTSYAGLKRGLIYGAAGVAVLAATAYGVSVGLHQAHQVPSYRGITDPSQCSPTFGCSGMAYDTSSNACSQDYGADSWEAMEGELSLRGTSPAEDACNALLHSAAHHGRQLADGCIAAAFFGSVTAALLLTKASYDLLCNARRVGG